MALITPGPLVSDISGKIGGTVFFQSRSGLTARRASGKVNPQTNFTRRSRSAFASVIGFWRTRSLEEREAWNTYAVFAGYTRTTRNGETRQLTGYQVFCSINVARLNVGYPVWPTPPANAPVMIAGFWDQEKTDAINGTWEIAFKGDLKTQTTNEAKFGIFASPPVPNNRQVIPASEMRLIGTLQKADLITPDPPDGWQYFDIGSLYQAYYQVQDEVVLDFVFRVSYLKEQLLLTDSHEDDEPVRKTVKR